MQKLSGPVVTGSLCRWLVCAARRRCSLFLVTDQGVGTGRVADAPGVVRAGVVGFGLAGRVFHTAFIAAVPALSLEGIVQRTGDDAARAYPAATVYRSLDELLASDVELVVIATPNETHVEFATAAVKAGKHVVIDKPFAPTLAGAQLLEGLAKESGRLVVPFHNRRFDGDFLTLEKLLRDGAVGRPVTLRSRFDRFRPVPRQNTWKEAEGEQNGSVDGPGTARGGPGACVVWHPVDRVGECTQGPGWKPD